MNLWLATDVLVRLVTKTPEDLFRRALALVEAAEAGRGRLAVHPLHVAEAAYVLRSLYGYSREEVRDDLGVVLRLRALDVWDGDRVLWPPGMWTSTTPIWPSGPPSGAILPVRRREP